MAFYTDGFIDGKPVPASEGESAEAKATREAAENAWKYVSIQSLSVFGEKKDIPVYALPDLAKACRVRKIGDPIAGKRCTADGTESDGAVPPALSTLQNSPAALAQVFPAAETLEADKPPKEVVDKLYVAWAGVLPEDLTKIVVVWSVPVRLLNAAAMFGKLQVEEEETEENAEEKPPRTVQEVVNVAVHGRLMVVQLDRPIAIDNSETQQLVIPAGVVGALYKTTNTVVEQEPDPELLAVLADGGEPNITPKAFTAAYKESVPYTEGISAEEAKKRQEQQEKKAEEEQKKKDEEAAANGEDAKKLPRPGSIPVETYSERVVAIANKPMTFKVVCVYPGEMMSVTVNSIQIPAWFACYKIFGDTAPGTLFPLTSLVSFTDPPSPEFSGVVRQVLSAAGHARVRISVGAYTDSVLVDRVLPTNTPEIGQTVVGYLATGSYVPGTEEAPEAIGSALWDAYTPFEGGSSGPSTVPRAIVAGGREANVIAALPRFPVPQNPAKPTDWSLLRLPLNFQHNAPLPAISPLANDWPIGTGLARLTRGSPAIPPYSWDADVDNTPPLTEVAPARLGGSYLAGPRTAYIVYSKPLPAQTLTVSDFVFSPPLPGTTTVAITIDNNTIKAIFSGDPYTPTAVQVAANAFITHRTKSDPYDPFTADVRNAGFTASLDLNATFSRNAQVRAVIWLSTAPTQFLVYTDMPLELTAGPPSGWTISGTPTAVTVTAAAVNGAAGTAVLTLSRALTNADTDTPITLTIAGSTPVLTATTQLRVTSGVVVDGSYSVALKAASLCYVPIVNRQTETTYPVGSHVEISAADPLLLADSLDVVRALYDSRIVEVGAYTTLRVGRGNILRVASNGWPAIYGLRAPAVGVLPTSVPYANPTELDFSSKTDEFTRGIAAGRIYPTDELVWIATAVQAGTIVYQMNGPYSIPEGAWVASTRVVRLGAGLVYIIDRAI